MDEFNTMLEQMLESVGPDVMLDLVLSQSVNDKPAFTLAEDLSQLSVRELRDLAHNVGLTGSISKMNKRTLVRNIADRMNAPTEYLLTLARTFGITYLQDLKHLCEENGHIALPVVEFESLKQIPAPHPPLSLLYFWNDTLHCVMPQEILAKLKEVDWDEEIRSAGPRERVLKYLDALVDLRGIVPLREAIDECITHVPDPPDAEEIETTLLAGSDGISSGFSVAVLYDMRCLVHGVLFDRIKDNDPDELDYVEELFVAQEEYPAHPVTDELLQAESVARMLCKQAPGKALTAILEKSAPDDMPATLFATGILIMLVGMSRESQRMSDLIDVLNQFAIQIDESEADEFISNYAQLMARVPCWDRNGWSLYEELRGEVVPQERIDEDLADILPFVPRS
ncbi:MAG: hypothetical protein IKG18_03385 [Atopobiaceae bacterium]|nr:hypothetical protein [Atopobiaceae bacterium]